LISLPALASIFLSLSPNGLIKSTELTQGEPSIFFNQIYHVAYIAYQSLYFLIAFSVLIVTYLKSKENEERSQLIYIFWGTFITASVSMVTNLLMPFFGYFDLNWLGQATSVSMIAFISLSLVEDRLFNLRTAATRLAVIILSSFMLIRIFVTASFREQIINFFIFVFAAVFGYILDKNVRETIKQREQIDKLAKRLASTNWELSRSNERLRIMDQRKSEFVSIVSHQLRTPVTAIKGYASLLLEGSYGEAPKEMVEAFSRIFTSSQRLVEMINDFLNISKIEQGTMSYTFAPVDLKILIVGLVEDFHVSAGQKKIDLEVAVDNSETYIVSADEGKIRQIISNLIDNAIKYTPKGSVRVTLEKDMHKGTNGYVLLKIKDTGVGLSQDDIHHLFGKFTRGSEGQKLNTSGSGLGLYVAKKMLEEHKGNIWVDSEGQGKGSVFCIELPLLPT
jgi:signal transduction histidine kinase